MNKVLEFLKKPRGAFLIAIYFLTVVFSVLSIFSAIAEAESGFLKIASYIVYALAAVLLFYTVYTIVVYAPWLKERVIAFLKTNKWTKNVMESYGYKTAVFSLFSTAITLTVVIINAVAAVRYRLFWYAALATYYLTLLIFRGVILLSGRRIGRRNISVTGPKSVGAWKIYLFVGAFLALLELSMAIVVATMLNNDRPFKSSEVIAITTAAYAFYKMSMAIYNIFKARRFRLPVVQAIRNLNFADACMSIFSLTVLLTSTFGGDEKNVTIIKTATAALCLLAVILTAAIMIFRAKINIKRLLGERVNDER